MACPAARLAVRPKHRVVVRLRSDDILLNALQQLLRFGQRQPQVGELAKTIRPADLHHVETSGLTINPLSTNRSIHSIRESPAGNIPDRSYRSDHNPPTVWTVPIERRTIGLNAGDALHYFVRRFAGI
jgi:hypothetical protein